jgi:diguanylate cyclase (GGDEF)-like protein
VLVLVIAGAGFCLCGWVFPPMEQMYQNIQFNIGGLMKANNAVTILLCSFSIALSEARRAKMAILLSRLLAGLAMLLAAVLVFERFSGITLPIDTFLAPDATSPHPGRVSIQACGTLLLMAFVLFFIRERKGFLSRLVDGITLCIVFLMLIFTSCYAFHVSYRGVIYSLFGETVLNPMSVATLLSLSSLTWLIFNRRAEYGIFSILIGSGIGGRTARFAAPCGLLIPYVFAIGRALAIQSHLLSEPSAAAAGTAAMAVLAFCLVLAIARKTDELEDADRELSLRDELTKLYNRRGFYALAELSLRGAQRDGEIFFLIFIDVDGLKKVNDTLGHEAGSELIRDTAALLQRTFRDTDVIGRVGGDEFVVAGHFDIQSGANQVRRLEEAIIQENLIPTRRIPISISAGYIQSDGARSGNLEQLLKKADMAMYEVKRAKRSSLGR